MVARSSRFAGQLALTAALAALQFAAGVAVAGQYGPGASDTEIKIGNIMPYSGPASAFATLGKTFTGYFKMINEKGGINGRKINFITYDDGYSPPKTVEQARRLVEDDEVLAIFGALGTPGNAAIQKYMNIKKVPQLFIGTGAARFGDPQQFPWSMGWNPTYRAEAQVYARYILQNYPDKKIGILYQNDDLGRDYLIGLKEGLGDNYAKMVVSEVPFEVAVPTVESHMVSIKTANPDIFINIGTPKFAAQAIKKIGEMNWHPVQFLTNVSASVSATLKPAGFENAKGVLSAAYRKDPADPTWDKDPTMIEFRAFMDKYVPDVDKLDSGAISAYGAAIGMTKLLQQAGDNLTRENIMTQAASFDFEDTAYLPGIRIKTSSTDFFPIEQLQMMKFTGESWQLFGPLIDVQTGR